MPAKCPRISVGLEMLARRELSELQVRDRLAHKAHVVDALDAAVARLPTERAIQVPSSGASRVRRSNVRGIFCGQRLIHPRITAICRSKPWVS